MFQTLLVTLLSILTVATAMFTVPRYITCLIYTGCITRQVASLAIVKGIFAPQAFHI